MGYEWDNNALPGAPAGVQTLSNSPVSGSGVIGRQQASVYQNAKGAIVFDAGTIYWPFFLTGNMISSQ